MAQPCAKGKTYLNTLWDDKALAIIGEAAAMLGVSRADYIRNATIRAALEDLRTLRMAKEETK